MQQRTPTVEQGHLKVAPSIDVLVDVSSITNHHLVEREQRRFPVCCCHHKWRGATTINMLQYVQTILVSYFRSSARRSTRHSLTHRPISPKIHVTQIQTGLRYSSFCLSLVTAALLQLPLATLMRHCRRNSRLFSIQFDLSTLSFSSFGTRRLRGCEQPQTTCSFRTATCKSTSPMVQSALPLTIKPLPEPSGLNEGSTKEPERTENTSRRSNQTTKSSEPSQPVPTVSCFSDPI